MPIGLVSGPTPGDTLASKLHNFSVQIDTSAAAISTEGLVASIFIEKDTPLENALRDWTLKTSLRFRCKALDLMQLASDAGGRAESYALEAFASKDQLEEQGTPEGGFTRQWALGMNYWCHPSNPMPRSILSKVAPSVEAYGKTRPFNFPQENSPSAAVLEAVESARNMAAQEIPPEVQWTLERRRQWGESLRSLYQLYRTKFCAYFYVKCIHFTIIFRFEETESVLPVAVMSHSTKLMRQHLRGGKPPVCFECPLAPELVHQETLSLDQIEEAMNNDTSKELKALQSESGYNGRVVNSTPSSRTHSNQHSKCALVFKGHMQVQGLLDYLQGADFSALNSKYDLPQLFSPSCFRNATLQSLRVKKVQRANIGVGGGSNEMEDKLAGSSHLEIEGPIMPFAVKELCTAVWKRLNTGQCDVTLKTDEHTFALNLGVRRATEPIPQNEDGADKKEMGYLPPVQQLSIQNHRVVCTDGKVDGPVCFDIGFDQTGMTFGQRLL
jgi:hypothetical protein